MNRNVYLAQLFFVLFLCSLASSCTDKCESAHTYYIWEPVTFTMDQVIDSVKSESPNTLSTLGKIYYKDKLIYISEVKKGIHVIDNTNPASPKNIAFIRIPGNFDIAIRNNTLYADSYTDLLSIDISNPLNAIIKNRIKNVFMNSGSAMGGFNYDVTKNLITTYQSKKVTTMEECNSYRNQWFENGIMLDGTMFSSTKSASAAPSNTTGKAGSMARFAIYQNYLYAVGNNDMKVFNISNTETPALSNSLIMDWGIETIWPYKDKLFIGSNRGMLIYDNKNPSLPEHLSTYSHITSCDPVVVDDKYAYVTLRTGNGCNRGVNQLEIVDIEDLKNPTQVKTYPMDNPHGLGLDKQVLFICDGDSGLKIYDAKDVLSIDTKLLAHYKDINTFDVIPLDGTLLMIGQDGLYQYDYSDITQIRQISKIEISSNE